jgi:hypothetical protein
VQHEEITLRELSLPTVLDRRHRTDMAIGQWPWFTRSSMGEAAGTTIPGFWFQRVKYGNS